MADSHADPDGPPVGSAVSGGPDATFTLPKASITVLRGKVEEASGQKCSALLIGRPE
ncbi:MAG TPA: hypothetical protein VG206_01290 [Terriglobia bacterium]|nr:hypothetical protein [Terriglobia bacterium]